MGIRKIPATVWQGFFCGVVLMYAHKSGESWPAVSENNMSPNGVVCFCLVLLFAVV